ncbi:MAG: hypothetical protein M3P32_00640 [Chloroflexota bacterium]|nr:hypothetical protein [Chloroflexota bacterium]
MTARKWLATSLAVLSVAEVLGILVVSSRGDPRFTVGADVVSIGFLGSVILFPMVGSLIIQRRPATRVAWFMIAAGIGLGLGLLTFGYGATGLPPGPVRPLALQAFVFSQLLFVPSIVAGALLVLLYFPNDRLPSPRWRPVLPMALLGTALFLVGTTFHPGPLDPDSAPGIQNPLGAPASWAGVVEAALTLGNLLLTLAILLAAISLILRYRRADPVEAAQIRWIALVSCVATPAFAIAAFPFGPISEAAFGLGLVGLSGMPIAIGIAITRYRLYEIDRLINRTLVYSALTAILAGVFTAGIGLAQRLFVGVTGETSDAAIVLTTLVVATLYAPLRKWLESFVDRRFKYDELRFGAYRSELKQLLSLVDPGQAGERLAREAVQELRATGGAVVDANDRPAATSGDWPQPTAVRIPIPGGDRGLAALLVGARRDGRPHDPRSIAELAEVATLVGNAARLKGPTRRHDG